MEEENIFQEEINCGWRDGWDKFSPGKIQQVEVIPPPPGVCNGKE